jgi:hypothetical protein
MEVASLGWARDRYGVKGTCGLEGVFIQFSNNDKKEDSGTL